MWRFCVILNFAILTQYRHVRDGHTDKDNDGIYRASIVSHGKSVSLLL